MLSEASSGNDRPRGKECLACLSGRYGPEACWRYDASMHLAEPLVSEPAAGVPSVESHRILQVLDKLPEHIAILIIEHDMDLVFRFAQRITVLVQGEVLVEGAPAEIAKDRRVHEVYLGEQRHV